MPRFSIIVPVYNVERYVGECVESLKRQTYADFEVVCVNDGSTDSSLEVAKRAAAGDERFVIVERENGGLSAARNTGLAAATGDYVCFLDSDDRYVVDALERLDRVLSSYEGDVHGERVVSSGTETGGASARGDHANRIDSGGADAGVSGMGSDVGTGSLAGCGGLDLLDFSAATFYETPDMRQVHEESYDYRDPVVGAMSGQDLFTLYWSRIQFVSSACFHAIRRSLLVENDWRFCEGLLHEDELFTPVLYSLAKRAAYLDEQLYERRVRPGSIMATPTSMRRVKSLVAIANLLHAWLIQNADWLKPAFIDAFTMDIAYLRDAAYQAANQVDAAALAAYLDDLSGKERAEFNLVARFANLPANARFHDIVESRDYRVGHAALKVPRMLKRLMGR